MAGAEFEYYEGLERAMGTIFRLHAFHPPGEREAMQALADCFFDAILADDRKLSLFVAESAVSRLNREAGGAPLALDEDSFALLTAAKSYWVATGGLFDVTAGVLMRRHGFYREAPLPAGELPREAEALRALVGCDKLELDPERRTARLARPGMLLDLGGLAKGWAIQRRLEILTAGGIADLLISAGTSTLVARGAPPGASGWPLELENPPGWGEEPDRLVLATGAVSVSGNYHHTLEQGGRTIRHIMHPLTLEPVEAVRQAMVAGPDAAECEALSTAVLIQGALEGPLAALTERPELSVRLREIS